MDLIQDQLSSMTLLIPFFMAFAVCIIGLFKPAYCQPVTALSLFAALLTSFKTLSDVIESGVIEYHMGGWSPPMGIALRIDTLNALVSIVIIAVALIAAISSRFEIQKAYPTKVPAYYTLFLLFVTGAVGITITGDAFNLYVLIEVAALTGYSLIAQGKRRAMIATFNYVILGSIGASFYLLGVGYLLIKTGSLNMVEINQIITEQNLAESATIKVAFILIMIGLFMKMALFPLHAWLPNAYSHCPYSSSNLISPIMTKVMIYVMARMIFTVFGLDYVFETIPWGDVIVWLAIFSIIGGSVMALAQTHLRKLLTYIIVTEVGYMVGGIWIVSKTAMLGALYHILSDAALTLCLFLAVMTVHNKTRQNTLSAFEGLYAKMPFTMAAFTLGALSMMGIPPSCGFFSKWYLISGAIETEHWAYAGALIFSSLANAVIFFRIIEIALFGAKPAEGHGHHHAAPVKINEAALFKLLPLIGIAAILIFMGLFNSDIIQVIDLTVSSYNDVSNILK